LLIKCQSPELGAQSVWQKIKYIMGGADLMISWPPPSEKMNIQCMNLKNKYTKIRC